MVFLLDLRPELGRKLFSFQSFFNIFLSNGDLRSVSGPLFTAGELLYDEQFVLFMLYAFGCLRLVRPEK